MMWIQSLMLYLFLLVPVLLYAQSPPIASMRYYEYFATIDEDGTIAKGNVIKHTHVNYKENGKITDSLVYGNKGNFLRKFTFIYNPNEILIEKKCTDSTFHFLFTQLYKYDSEGRILSSQKVNDKTDTVESVIYRYLPDNIYEITHCQEKKPTQIRTYQCLKDYLYPLKITIQIGDSLTYTQALYQYNEQFQLIDERSFSVAGDMLHHYVFQYDENGRMSTKSHYSEKGTLLRKYVYQRDENGNVINEIWYGQDDFLLYKISFSYRYDEEKNYVLRMTYEGDPPVLKRIIERTVSYFEL